MISTIDGDGTSGSGTGELSAPGGVVVNSSGVVYIADQNNDRIEAVLSSGNTVTVAGTGMPGFNGDGLPATSTQLFSPGDMAIGPDGTIYFADKGNHRVREIGTTTPSPPWRRCRPARWPLMPRAKSTSPMGRSHEFFRSTRRASGIIAGTGTRGFAGDGGPALAAQFNSPCGIAADAQGNLYIADTGNNRIRVISADGNIQTIAGTGAADFDGDGGPALAAAECSHRAGWSMLAGNIWMADSGNNRVRKCRPRRLPHRR